MGESKRVSNRGSTAARVPKNDNNRGSTSGRRSGWSRLQAAGFKVEEPMPASKDNSVDASNHEICKSQASEELPFVGTALAEGSSDVRTCISVDSQENIAMRSESVDSQLQTRPATTYSNSLALEELPILSSPPVEERFCYADEDSQENIAPRIDSLDSNAESRECQLQTSLAAALNKSLASGELILLVNSCTQETSASAICALVGSQENLASRSKSVDSQLQTGPATAHSNSLTLEEFPILSSPSVEERFCYADEDSQENIAPRIDSLDSNAESRECQLQTSLAAALNKSLASGELMLVVNSCTQEASASTTCALVDSQENLASRIKSLDSNAETTECQVQGRLAAALSKSLASGELALAVNSCAQEVSASRTCASVDTLGSNAESTYVDTLGLMSNNSLTSGEPPTSMNPLVEEHSSFVAEGAPEVTPEVTIGEFSGGQTPATVREETSSSSLLFVCPETQPATLQTPQTKVRGRKRAAVRRFFRRMACYA